MLCGNEQHISCCYESEPCPEIVRHPDSVVGHRSGLISGFGQGLCFSEIEPVEQFELQQLVAMLAGRSRASNREPVGEKTMKTSSDPGDAISVLDEIREFFRINPLLSRDECHPITEGARRSRILLLGIGGGRPVWQAS